MMKGPAPGIALVAALAFGCPTLDEAAPTRASRLHDAWVAKVVSEPSLFAERVGRNREGWIALHRNDWLAARASGGDPAARAHAELARFYTVLADLNAEAWERLGSRWSERGTLPVGSALAWLVGAALADVGRPTASWPTGDAPAPALSERHAAHLAARSTDTPPAALRDAAAAPLLEETGSDGTTRTFYDPWVFRTLAQAETQAGAAAAPGDVELFSGSLAGATPKLPPQASTPVLDADACRDTVRALDAELDAWRLAVAGSAPPDGLQLLGELRLADGARARALVDLAVEALNAGRPSCSLALGQLALDHEAPRALGPVNSPTLFAVVAASQLRSGRTREALDALEVLGDPYPEVRGLDETMSTLVVLEGLDRRGDSRE